MKARANTLLNATLIDETTRGLLKINGLDDGRRGITKEDGWKEISDACEYPPMSTRTPALEAYLDGWFEGAGMRPQAEGARRG